MLPIVSCAMSHFKRELSSEHFSNWIMVVHLRDGGSFKFRTVYRSMPKVHRLDGVLHSVPINIRCPVFNEIPPIWDCQWGQPEWGQWIQNDGHWLLRTQTWVISTKEWDVVFFQWSIAWYVREKFGIGNCWRSLHFWNASFDGGRTVWGQNRIGLDTTKGRFFWIEGYFRWQFIVVGVEEIVY